jgi:hypothetical protein
MIKLVLWGRDVQNTTVGSNLVHYFVNRISLEHGNVCSFTHSLWLLSDKVIKLSSKDRDLMPCKAEIFDSLALNKIFQPQFYLGNLM